MRLTFLFIISLFSLGSWGMTEFRWITLDPSLPETGHCYDVAKNLEIDHLVKDQIENYVKKVKDENCRPKKVGVGFNNRLGKCYEVDVETKGEKFYSETDLEKCRTTNLKYAQIIVGDKTRCCEVDAETGGKIYFKKVAENFCITQDSRYEWVAKSETSGQCFMIKEGQAHLKVKKNLCRPDQPVYKFVRTGPFGGYCLEQSSDPDYPYSTRVKTDFCRVPGTSFFFYKASGRKSGNCYEVDNETRGDKYVNRVKAEFCK
jgi:hypothetical protein